MPRIYKNEEDWKKDLQVKEARLQWDPDHDPAGKPIERRAIQLGLKGNILNEFATKHIEYIEDITPFVLEQYSNLRNGDLNKLMVPIERVYRPHASSVCAGIGID